MGTEDIEDVHYSDSRMVIDLKDSFKVFFFFHSLSLDRPTETNKENNS